MIGAYISDDFYFFFEEEEILKLQKDEFLEGRFAAVSNEGQGIVSCKLNVFLKQETKEFHRSDIEMSFLQKIANLYITKEDFNDWFIDADDWVRRNGPSVRFGSTNVYISRGISDNAEMRKIEIQNFINQAGP